MFYSQGRDLQKSHKGKSSPFNKYTWVTLVWPTLHLRLERHQLQYKFLVLCTKSPVLIAWFRPSTVNRKLEYCCVPNLGFVLQTAPWSNTTPNRELNRERELHVIHHQHHMSTTLLRNCQRWVDLSAYERSVTHIPDAIHEETHSHTAALSFHGFTGNIWLC